jgi:hypothetical protein
VREREERKNKKDYSCEFTTFFAIKLFYNVLTYSTVCGLLGWFHSGAVMNNTTIKVFYTSLGAYGHIFSAVYLQQKF